MTPLERMARAISRERHGIAEYWPPYVPAARRALEALKYEDGTDESRLIDVAAKFRMDPVCLGETWDTMIDAILAEPTGA